MSNKKNKEVSESQGLEDMSAKEVAQWLRRDLVVALTLLDALRSDTELLELMATFLQGRYINEKNKDRVNGNVNVE